jgi:hypothetical protein
MCNWILFPLKQVESFLTNFIFPPARYLWHEGLYINCYVPAFREDAGQQARADPVTADAVKWLVGWGAKK